MDAFASTQLAGLAQILEVAVRQVRGEEVMILSVMADLGTPESQRVG
jgi:hypothetical protein